jgi:hypothetical protein
MTEAQATAVTTEAPARYYDFVDGDQLLWLTSIAWERGVQGKRDFVKLTFTTEPTSKTYEAPFTQHRLYLPRQDDAQMTRITMDRKLKMILCPIADKDASGPLKMSELLKAAKANLAKLDVQCNVTCVLEDGKSVNPKTGEQTKFASIVAFDVKQVVEKGAYDGIELDDVFADDLLPS